MLFTLYNTKINKFQNIFDFFLSETDIFIYPFHVITSSCVNATSTRRILELCC